MLSYGRHLIDDDDVASVASVLKGDWLTQGPSVEAFEEAIADYVETSFAVAFSSGTAALHAAVVAAEIGRGDVVYTSPLTFMASANAARYVGAKPGLVDIDPSTLNMKMSSVPDSADAVIPVHYAGLPVALSDAHRKFRVIIEDAAHALGSRTPEGAVGNCVHSDMCCFSFHPVKPITTGEGGIVTTNNPELYEKLKRFRSHEIERKSEFGGWYYSISRLGFNYRLPDVLAALGLSQLKKLDRYIAIRNEIAETYRALLAGDEVILPPEAPKGYVHGYHLFPIQIENRREAYDYLHSVGVGVQVHYVPVHHHPISQDVVIQGGGLPNCDFVYDHLLSLPIHPGMLKQDVEFVVSKIRDFKSIEIAK